MRATLTPASTRSGNASGVKNRHCVSTTKPMTGLRRMSRTPLLISSSFTAVSKNAW